MIDLQKVDTDLKVNGYAVIPNFLSIDEIQDMKNECKAIIDGMDLNEEQTVFMGGNSQTANEYFMSSGDKIRFFYEKEAFDKSGKLIVDKYVCLNKMGHALHWLSPIFKRYTFSDKVKQVIKHLGFVDPVVVQSMYIFKNPGVGAEVVPHQDSTFLFSTPDPKVIGLWFALEDATTENGCLSFIPGSHNEGLHNRWVRQTNGENVSMKLTQDNKQFDSTRFINAPVDKGSCVLIDGLVVHRSDFNRSKNGRPIYTFHIFDRYNRQWDPNNWLQPSEELPFPSLYDK